MKRCSCCEVSYTKAQWERLPLVGHQPIPAGEHYEPPFTLELRNCPCGTTLAVNLVS